MTNVLVDSSVWVAHFKQPNRVLLDLLDQDRVLGHPLVLGEIACGTPPNRANVLRDLSDLEPAEQATMDEVLEFIARQRVYGRGCGLIDLTLLASAMMTPNTLLWTLDKRLAFQADLFKVLYLP
jgi:predicted nucleic acid-binding protein